MYIMVEIKAEPAHHPSSRSDEKNLSTKAKKHLDLKTDSILWILPRDTV
jgi:hypothetical protein